jgi:hypothetical protein
MYTDHVAAVGTLHLLTTSDSVPDQKNLPWDENCSGKRREMLTG